MSIVTRTGDQGTTALMYGRRVSKCDDRVEAYGTVDELNSAIGLARATAPAGPVREFLAAIQQDLVVLMGELATAAEDLDRYAKDGHTLVTSSLTTKLETALEEMEARGVKFSGWATPGATLHAAALDLARSVCRRAERCVCFLRDSGKAGNPEILIFLNRLSDLLWLLAREAETPPS